MLTFPLSALLLKALGSPAGIPEGRPANRLAMQSAFTVPIGMLLAIALGRTNPELFFPATMILVGAHCLTFIPLSAMRHHAVLTAALVLAGTTGGVVGASPRRSGSMLRAGARPRIRSSREEMAMTAQPYCQFTAVDRCSCRAR